MHIPTYGDQGPQDPRTLQIPEEPEDDTPLVVIDKDASEEPAVSRLWDVVMVVLAFGVFAVSGLYGFSGRQCVDYTSNSTIFMMRGTLIALNQASLAVGTISSSTLCIVAYKKNFDHGPSMFGLFLSLVFTGWSFGYLLVG